MPLTQAIHSLIHTRTHVPKLTPDFQRCACDVPAHAYTYSWEGNPRWSRAYVGSLELFDYFKSRAVAYGVSEFVKLNHKVTSATWNERKGKWEVEITNLENNTTVQDEGEIFINGTGFLKYVQSLTIASI